MFDAIKQAFLWKSTGICKNSTGGVSTTLEVPFTVDIACALDTFAAKQKFQSRNQTAMNYDCWWSVAEIVSKTVKITSNFIGLFWFPLAIISYSGKLRIYLFLQQLKEIPAYDHPVCTSIYYSTVVPFYHIRTRESAKYRYFNNIYQTSADSVFRALWLATQARDSIYYSPPGTFRDFVREFRLISQKKETIWCRISTRFVYAKIIIHLSVGGEW